MELINKLHAFTTTEIYWPGINLDDKIHQRTKTQTLNRIAVIIINFLSCLPSHIVHVSHYWQHTHFYKFKAKCKLKIWMVKH